MLRKGNHDLRITNHTAASVRNQNGPISRSLNGVAQTFLAMVGWRHNGRSGWKPKQWVTHNAEPLPMEVKWFPLLSLSTTSNRNTWRLRFSKCAVMDNLWSSEAAGIAKTGTQLSRYTLTIPFELFQFVISSNIVIHWNVSALARWIAMVK